MYTLQTGSSSLTNGKFIGVIRCTVAALLGICCTVFLLLPASKIPFASWSACRHLSCRTKQTYWDWVKRFILFHHKENPRDMSAVECFLYLNADVKRGDRRDKG